MRPLPFLAAFFLCAVLVFPLFAQEDDEEPGGIPIESDWQGVTFSRYQRGDQAIGINLGLVKPLFYLDQKDGYLDTQMNLGGTISLSFSYFFGPHLFIGAEVSGMFASTVGKNMYYSVPIGFRTGYQFVYRRFEFPLVMMVGFAPQSHKQNYLGFFAKPTGAVFFRFNNDWSFGFTTGPWWVPQWTFKTREGHSGNVSIHGFFWEFSIGARYHF